MAIRKIGAKRSAMKASAAKVVRRMRVDAGTWDELIESAWEHYKEGGRESIRQAFTEAVADSVIKRYSEKIRNGFERAGLHIDSDVQLNAKTLAAVVSEKTGLDIETMTPQSVTAAIDKVMAAKATEVLRVPVSSVMNIGEFRQSIEEAALKAIEDGRAVEYISKVAIRAARKFETMKRRGLETKEDQKSYLNRVAQKKFRKTHKLVWIEK